jgi:hypothetical protein
VESCGINHRYSNRGEQGQDYRFLFVFEMLVNRDTPVRLEETTEALQSDIGLARSVIRSDDRGPDAGFSDLSFTIRELLIHIPVQLWPLPNVTHCPCGCCDVGFLDCALEQHLREVHANVLAHNRFHTPLQLTISGLLGLDVILQEKTATTKPIQRIRIVRFYRIQKVTTRFSCN